MLNMSPETWIIYSRGSGSGLLIVIWHFEWGDEVLVPEPRYNAYDDAILMLGGTPKIVPCTPDADFLMTPQQIKASITKKTKAISLVNPGNPVGMYEPDQVKEICKIAAKRISLF